MTEEDEYSVLLLLLYLVPIIKIPSSFVILCGKDPISTHPRNNTTNIMTALNEIVPPGVVTGDNLLKLLSHAKENGYAIPAFNCTR
jgi:hypothetical protein